MQIDVVTLFPEVFEGALSTGVLGRAARNGVLEVRLHQLRDFAAGKHAVVDDAPYGGGPGMVMKPEPIFAAVESITAGLERKPLIVLLSPQGRPLTDGLARRMAATGSLVLICGHYEGVDERVAEHLVDDEISIGDYVLSGGELPALVLIDAVARYVPGVLGSIDSAARDSFSTGLGGLLQGPVYTRPAEFRGWKVPEILLSGDHLAIDAWRKRHVTERSRARRPDLLK